MNLTVRYFASFRDALGQGSETLATQAVTVAALRDELIARGGAHAQILARGRSVRVALDRTMVEETAALADGCEVAFFPPVTGG